MDFQKARSKLPELEEFLQIVESLGSRADCELLTSVPHGGADYPVYSLDFNPGEEHLPTLVLVGGVHGVERIGTQVILSYLQTLSAYLQWDESLQELFRKMRLVVIPFLNPTGMVLQNRANANGIDLMRNAPVEAAKKTTFLSPYRGHRLSSSLPWYRGKEGAPMELEAQALCDFMEKKTFNSKVVVSLDVHSGFGAVDRLWFPYAKSKEPIDQKTELYAMKDLLDRTLPNHVYKFEPQSLQYTTHGDLWDHLYDRHRETHREKTFIPLTLEMGSWSWLRKNPFQIFSPLGLFHPIKKHRRRRVMRRHAPFLDFLMRSTAFSKMWVDLAPEVYQEMERKSDQLWTDSGS